MEFLTALVLTVTTFFQSLIGQKPPAPPANLPEQVEQVKNPNAVQLVLVPTASDVEIHLKGNNEKLSALALRVTYHYSKNPGNITISANTNLAQSNWMFPVKKVTNNTSQSTLVIDLAAANISTTGFVLGQDLLLGKINLAGIDQASLKNFSFDQKETKLYSKDTQEIPLAY